MIELAGDVMIAVVWFGIAYVFLAVVSLCVATVGAFLFDHNEPEP